MIKSGSNPLKPKKNITPLGLGCGCSKGIHNSADTIYQVLKAIYEHHDEWKDVHPIAKRWHVNRAIDNVVQPLHAPAIRYSKEKGIWSAKMEAKQQALLAQ
ncbi:TAXI family TRAP transporter solute-binding subunit [Alphaproteobacteria bacterium]|nr:TAXI family TRAP transporter solute-binding subunit [Alphaproteobacteria bacterium]